MCYSFMILICASIVNHFTPFPVKKSILFKVFITNEPKVVISGIFYLLIFMMILHETKEIKVWSMKYGHRDTNDESYVWPREPMK